MVIGQGQRPQRPISGAWYVYGIIGPMVHLSLKALSLSLKLKIDDFINSQSL
jgi:hypothetical protein